MPRGRRSRQRERSRCESEVPGSDADPKRPAQTHRGGQYGGRYSRTGGDRWRGHDLPLLVGESLDDGQAKRTLAGMNEETRQYRLLEVKPVKVAMMEAHQRATEFLPPLRKFKGGWEPWPDLAHAIANLSRKERDPKLKDACDKFLQACGAATEAWMKARSDLYGAQQHDPLYGYGPDHVPTDAIVTEYRRGTPRSSCSR